MSSPVSCCRLPSLVKSLLACRAGVCFVAAVIELTIAPGMQVLQGAMDAVQAFVGSCPADAQAAACSALYASLFRNQDYTRKLVLIAWYQRLAAAVEKRQALRG